MTRLMDDVKSGLKGIRGAGEVIRGEALEATDRAFERDPHHPAVAASTAENRGVSDQGRRDVKGMDEMFAKREWEKKGVPREAQAQAPVPTTAAATHPPPHQTTHTTAPQGENLTGSTYAGAEGIGHHHGGGGGAYEPGVAHGHADTRQAQAPMPTTGTHPPPPPPHQTTHTTAPGRENLVGAHPRAEGLGHNHGGGSGVVPPDHTQAREGLHAPTGGAPAYDVNAPPPPLPERHPEPGLTTHGEPLHHNTGTTTGPTGGLSQDPAANPPSQPRYA
ncbi:hypothetical protein N3K66_008266 [Trichothecium roseum]|uniref:Uncharacterized protein n=1 Tax=Trichothecium roseum TaxID=47278 RepID=A0ACC0USX5_9HYPO|nr:hypothetical protein N3K66_008266 [Trichothecium roseum]